MINDEEIVIDLTDEKQIDFIFPNYFWINPYKDFPDSVINATSEHIWYILAKPYVFGLSIEDLKRILDKYDIKYNQKMLKELPDDVFNNEVWSELIKLANKNHWVRGSKQSNTIFNLQSTNIKDIHKVVNLINKTAYIDRVYVDTQVSQPSDGSTVSYNNKLSGKRLEKFIKTGHIPTTMIQESTTEYTPKHFDPALLTFDEYKQIINKDDKYHESCAYRWTVVDKSILGGDNKRNDYPNIINHIKRNGINFEIRMKKIDKITDYTYTKYNPETNEYVYDNNGKVEYFTVEELLHGSLPILLENRYEYSFGIFTEDDGQVASLQDEWGCVLITVANEFQHFGLGSILSDIWLKYLPKKSSGGFTHAGYNTFKNAYIRLVKKYLASGFYSYLIKSGQISKERVKNILKSVNLNVEQIIKPSIDLSMNPKDNLLFFDDMGTFILYNKKYKELYDNEKYSYFVDKMLLGAIYVSIDDKYARIKMLGGNDKVKELLLQFAGSWVKQFNVPLVVEKNDEQYLKNFKFIEKSKKSGYESSIVEYNGTPININLLTFPEKEFRKSFDKYDEFKYTLYEESEMKFR